MIHRKFLKEIHPLPPTFLSLSLPLSFSPSFFLPLSIRPPGLVLVFFYPRARGLVLRASSQWTLDFEGRTEVKRQRTSHPTTSTCYKRAVSSEEYRGWSSSTINLPNSFFLRPIFIYFFFSFFSNTSVLAKLDIERGIFKLIFIDP